MSRYIDADKLMIKLSNVYVDLNKNMSSGEALAYLGAFILDAPTADVQDVRHLTPCDVCKYNPPSSNDGKPCSICPACTKMDEEEQK